MALLEVNDELLKLVREVAGASDDRAAVHHVLMEVVRCSSLREVLRQRCETSEVFEDPAAAEAAWQAGAEARHKQLEEALEALRSLGDDVFWPGYLEEMGYKDP
jgi:Arc/MetJ family transcription regulator